LSETDLDEVLQTTAVFNNVSKGLMAKEKQLEEASGTQDEHKICGDPDQGELQVYPSTIVHRLHSMQVSDKERKLEYDNLYKDVVP